jgi:hypothetical protein
MKTPEACVLATFSKGKYTYRILRTEDGENLVLERYTNNASGELSWEELPFQRLGLSYILDDSYWEQIYKRASKISGSSRIFSTIDHPDIPKTYQGILEANYTMQHWTGRPIHILYKRSKERSLDFETYVPCLRVVDSCDPIIIQGIIAGLAIYDGQDSSSS